MGMALLEAGYGLHQSDSFADFLRIQGLCHRRMGKTRVDEGSTSIGVVYKRDKFGSLIQVHRIEGTLYESKEQAEQHGIEL